MISISFFGFAHVAFELAYIRKNLSEKIPFQFLILIMGLLLILVLVRSLNLITPIPNMLAIEITILVSLLLGSLYFTARLSVAILLVLFCLGFLCNPYILLFCLAFLHNLTPWGFLHLQKCAGKAWVMFLVNPLLVFILALNHTIDPYFFLPAQSSVYLSHYLLLPKLTALNFAFFAAAVYLQLIHYYCVLRVLPKLSSSPIVINKCQIFLFALIGFLFLVFFKQTKPIYGIVALFHAYLEIPLLLYLLVAEKKSSTHLIQLPN